MRRVELAARQARREVVAVVTDAPVPLHGKQRTHEVQSGASDRLSKPNVLPLELVVQLADLCPEVGCGRFQLALRARITRVRSPAIARAPSRPERSVSGLGDETRSVLGSHRFALLSTPRAARYAASHVSMYSVIGADSGRASIAASAASRAVFVGKRCSTVQDFGLPMIASGV
jgi:hypothetical protein